MKNPLRKRLLRELKNDIGKYLVIFLFMTATIGFVSGFLVADESMLYAYDESFEKYNVENGNFTTEQKLTDNQRTRLEKEKVTISIKTKMPTRIWIRNQRARFVFLKTEQRSIWSA